MTHTSPDTTSLKNKRIIFFGTEDFSAISLRALIAAGFDIAAVVTKPDSKKGRGRELLPPIVKVIAEEHGIPVWQPTSLNDIVDNIKSLQPVTGVLVSFGKLIPQLIIDLFTPGIINIHPSLLPKYRGPSPIEATILKNDDDAGVTLMLLSAKMDAGPIYQQKTIEDIYTETKEQLYRRLGSIGAHMLTDLLPAIMANQITPTPQDDSKASYCRIITKQDGIIDWNKTAEALQQEVIAYKGWPGSKTTIKGVEIIITSAHASPEPGQFGIKCSDGLYLVIDSLKPLGKKEMPIAAFLAGYGARLKD